MWLAEIWTPDDIQIISHDNYDILWPLYGYVKYEHLKSSPNLVTSHGIIDFQSWFPMVFPWVFPIRILWSHWPIGIPGITMPPSVVSSPGCDWTYPVPVEISHLDVDGKEGVAEISIMLWYFVIYNMRSCIYIYILYSVHRIYIYICICICICI